LNAPHARHVMYRMRNIVCFAYATCLLFRMRYISNVCDTLLFRIRYIWMCHIRILNAPHARHVMYRMRNIVCFAYATCLLFRMRYISNVYDTNQVRRIWKFNFYFNQHIIQYRMRWRLLFHIRNIQSIAYDTYLRFVCDAWATAYGTYLVFTCIWHLIVSHALPLVTHTERNTWNSSLTFIL